MCSLQPYNLLLKHSATGMSSAMSGRHAQLLELVAKVIAHAVFHGETIELHLTTPMIKQVLQRIINSVIKMYLATPISNKTAYSVNYGIACILAHNPTQTFKCYMASAFSTARTASYDPYDQTGVITFST